MAKCTGAILASGKSSRMGEDKAELRLRGKTLLQHMQGILETAGCAPVLISHPDHIPDIIPGRGPLSGIHAILQRLSAQPQPVLFVPIDMPVLTASLLEKLLLAPSDAPLVQFASHKMPFRLQADKQWLELAERLLQNGDEVSLGAFQNRIQSAHQLDVTPTEQFCFQNINTPEAWRIFVESENA